MAGFHFHPTPLIGLEAVSATSAHVFPKHTHDTFGIGFLSAGAQISASGRGQVEAEAGQLITVNPGEVHDGMPIGRMPRTWHMLYISPELMRGSISDLVSATGDIEFEHPVFADPAIRQLLINMHEKVRSEPLTEGAPVLQEQLILLLGRSLVRRDRPSPCPSSRLARLRQRLDDNPAKPADLNALANEAGLSRFQLIRAFQRYTGLTPHAYHMQSRANFSRRLLGLGMSPAEVAAACGYVDQSHMHREFRRRFGLTPGAYRSAYSSRNPVQDRSL